MTGRDHIGVPGGDAVVDEALWSCRAGEARAAALRGATVVAVEDDAAVLREAIENTRAAGFPLPGHCATLAGQSTCETLDDDDSLSGGAGCVPARRGRSCGAQGRDLRPARP